VATVKVRLFAALRDAAGTAEITVQAATLAEVRAQLSERFGPTFTARLERSRAWVGGLDVALDHALSDGDEVAILPPFAGG